MPAAGRAGPEVSAQLRLTDAPQAAAEGRRFAQARLEEWEIADDVVDVAVLLTSEVITNALRHAPPPLGLHLRVTGDVLRITVTDSQPHPPRPARPDFDREGGRGLWLLGELAARWGSEPDGTGKRVWFELPASRGDSTRAELASASDDRPSRG